ncbi:MAG: SRPBCC family protein [Dehalococcoidia bacterium]
MSERVVVERWLAAPPERVWSYFTDGDLWARWQGTAASVDPRPGGAIVLAMGRDAAVAGARGEFVLLERPTRLVFTWGWVDAPFGDVPPGSTTVEVDLVAEAGGTRLRLTHTGLPEGLDGVHNEGWRLYLGRLATVLEGGEPGPDPSLAD